MPKKKTEQKSAENKKEKKSTPKSKGSPVAKGVKKALKQEAARQVRKRFGLFGRLLPLKVLIFLLLLGVSDQRQSPLSRKKRFPLPWKKSILSCWEDAITPSGSCSCLFPDIRIPTVWKTPPVIRSNSFLPPRR